MQTTFYMSFISMAYLPLLFTASFIDFDNGNGFLSALAFFPHGLSDFSQTWYSVTGKTILQAEIIGIFKQFVYKTRDKIYPELWDRLKDRSWTWNEFNTQQTSIQAYVNLYGGGKYEIHARYSTALVYIAMAFLYGTAMPMFFPVVVAHLFVMYCYDRVTLCWMYTHPPAYSAAMTSRALKIMKFIPLFGLPWVYWQLGNRQIFDNVIVDIKTVHDVHPSLHTPYQSIKTLISEGYHAPNFVPAIAFILAVVYLG